MSSKDVEATAHAPKNPLVHIQKFRQDIGEHDDFLIAFLLTVLPSPLLVNLKAQIDCWASPINGKTQDVDSVAHVVLQLF